MWTLTNHTWKSHTLWRRSGVQINTASANFSLSTMQCQSMWKQNQNQGTSKGNRCINVTVTESQTYHWKCFHQLLCDVPEVSFEQNPWGQQFPQPESYCQGYVYSHVDETAELMSVKVRLKQKSYPHSLREDHCIVWIVFSSVASSNHDNIHKWWHYSRSLLTLTTNRLIILNISKKNLPTTKLLIKTRYTYIIWIISYIVPLT